MMDTKISIITVQSEFCMVHFMNYAFCLWYIKGEFPNADVNECTTGTHNCAQNCLNEDGYFSCSCESGFTLASDGKTCNGRL